MKSKNVKNSCEDRLEDSSMEQKKKNFESLKLNLVDRKSSKLIFLFSLSLSLAGNCFALAGLPRRPAIGARTLEGRSITEKRKQNKGIEKGKKGRKGKAATKEQQEI